MYTFYFLDLKFAKWQFPLWHILQILLEYCKYVYFSIFTIQILQQHLNFFSDIGRKYLLGYRKKMRTFTCRSTFPLWCRWRIARTRGCRPASTARPARTRSASSPASCPRWKHLIVGRSRCIRTVCHSLFHYVSGRLGTCMDLSFSPLSLIQLLGRCFANFAVCTTRYWIYWIQIHKKIKNKLLEKQEKFWVKIAVSTRWNL